MVERVLQDAEKKMGNRGGGVQNAAFDSLQVQTCAGVDGSFCKQVFRFWKYSIRLACQVVVVLSAPREDDGLSV